MASPRASAASGAPADPQTDPMKPRQPTKEVKTCAPARNFTLNLEQRLAAAMNGPPPYAVRLRKIEDLQAKLARDWAKEEDCGTAPAPLAVVRGLEELNRLIENHNRFYPIERNLPLDVATGELTLGGEPWRPMSGLLLDELRAVALALHG
jgi:hypothetical protein